MFRYGAAKRLLDRARLGTDTNIWQLFVGHPSMADILERTVPGFGDPAVNITGPSGQPWSIHLADVRDVVEGVLLVLRHPRAMGDVFNIAGPEPTAYDDGAQVIAEALSLPCYRVTMPADWRLEVDITKARRLLDFKPVWTFSKMVATAISGQGGAAEVIPAGKLPI